MASKFGGGGTKCTVCDKTSYPAETVSFEKLPYHIDCFRCQMMKDDGEGGTAKCNTKLKPADAAKYEDMVYCRKCFAAGGFAQKQRNVTWTKKEGSSSGAASSKFGGGGAKCTVCEKTVYAAEAVSFEKKIYHPACFKCKTCDKVKTPADAAEFEGDIFCRKCFQEGGYAQKQAKTKKPDADASGEPKTYDSRFAKFGGGGQKCVRCDKTVYAAETLSFEKMKYHANCFTCETCDKKMTPSGAEYHGSTKTVHCTKCFQANGYNRADKA